MLRERTQAGLQEIDEMLHRVILAQGRACVLAQTSWADRAKIATSTQSPAADAIHNPTTGAALQ